MTLCAAEYAADYLSDTLSLTSYTQKVSKPIDQLCADSSKPWSLDKEAAKNFAGLLALCRRRADVSLIPTSFLTMPLHPEYAAEEINKSVVW
jgi:hypothetical protein